MSKALSYSGEDHARSVIPYIGGKHQLVENIVPIIEYAAGAYGLTQYYELCGGGARMLLNLSPSLFTHRVYNDMDKGLCNLFACLGDHERVYALMARLEELGCSEEMFEQAKQARNYEASMHDKGYLDFELDQVTSAAYTFLLACLSRAADMQKYDPTRASNPARWRSYMRRIAKLDQFFPTLAGIEVTHGSCFEWLDLLCGANAFVYLDPPYTPEECTLQDHYGDRSWTVKQHAVLIDKLLVMDAKVALSGYDNKGYERLVEAGWEKLHLKNVSVSSSANGRRQDEFIWVSSNISMPSSLKAQVCHFDYTAW